ncbi:hypothetical protein UlMin_005935 [Ulmus minor]
MDVNEAGRTVVAKPVATRPSCSSFTSFTELLAGAIDASPSNQSSETAVAAIRPKTVRFKPMVHRSAPGLVSSSSQVEISGPSKSDGKSSVVYKPLAKVVSKTTASLLANMGNFDKSLQVQASVGSQVQNSQVQNSNQEKESFKSKFSSNPQQNVLPSRAETNQIAEPLKMALQNQEEDPKSVPSVANTDRPSYDGYNWRKYGQKQVKGSEYPRSYYKCTHPNCPVKKKVERSLDGQIAEIVYKGEHNHLKPQPSKRGSSGTQGLGLALEATNLDTNNLRSRLVIETNEASEGRVENKNHSIAYDSVETGAVTAGGGTPDNSCGPNAECEEPSKVIEAEEDEPRSKRRKGEHQSNEVGTSGEGAQDSRVVVQNVADPEVSGDGFRWRKYGQKVVKGNPYPRSYYRCTSHKCNVRKHVERASEDPKAFITTYEGKHNHEMPLKNPNSVMSSELDSQTPATKH